jgi:competence ComEA-like helix-hairpin-helix protein
MRIVNFREKLGGFYSVDQLAETYGLPDSTYQLIRPRLICRNAVVRKININDASVEELKNHPYIKWNLANVIMQYRKQHGPFKSIEQLEQLLLVTKEQLVKLLPYLSVE